MSKSTRYSDLTTALDQNNHIETLINGKFNQELRNRIAHNLETEHNIKKGRSPKKTFRLFPILSGIAASFLVLFLFTQTQHTDNILNHELIIASLDTKLVHPGQTKGAASSELNRNLAIELFNKENFASAYAEFGQIESPSEEDLFYKAMSLFYSNEFESANEELLPLLKEGSSFYEEVRWYLAITEIQIGDLNAAKDLLADISEHEWNYDKSQNLLNSIK